MKLYNYLKALIQSQVSSVGARVLGCPGMEFDTYGRQVGARLIARADLKGIGLLINPVSIVRYFEFPFVADFLRGKRYSRCLDVSSPFLLSLYLKEREIVDEIQMVNPDLPDITRSAAIISKLAIHGISTRRAKVEELSPLETYDAIWSVSVLEHIPDQDGDSKAAIKLYALLNPGGRLIITVPVDRSYRIERKLFDTYSTGVACDEDGKRFFQRVYDKTNITNRLIDAIGIPPTVLQLFGEKKSGTYADYESRWSVEGQSVTATDALRIARDYRDFQSWADMPGLGVCGLIFDKPKERGVT